MSGSVISGAASGEPTGREIREVFVGLMIVLGLAAVDQSIVATALPRIVSELGGVTHLSWVVTAYVLTGTATMPLYGKLSDQYGRKPVLYAAIVIFLIGSALSGAARSLLQLILFRAVQGLGAGGLLPLAQIIIGDLVPPAQRGRRQGAIVAVFAVCSVLGPLLGGLITDLLSWHWIFYVNLPIGAVSLIVIARALRRPQQTRRRRIDYLGATLLTAATTALLLVLALGGTEWPWDSPEIATSAGAAVALGALLVLHLRRVPEPVLPPELFSDRLFVIVCTVAALTFMGMAGSSLFFPLFFQLVMGMSASYSGLLTGPMMVGVVISSVVNGRRAAPLRALQAHADRGACRGGRCFRRACLGHRDGAESVGDRARDVRARSRARARHAQHDDRGAKRAADRPSRRRHRDARLLPLAGRAHRRRRRRRDPLPRVARGGRRRVRDGRAEAGRSPQRDAVARGARGARRGLPARHRHRVHDRRLHRRARARDDLPDAGIAAARDACGGRSRAAASR